MGKKKLPKRKKENRRKRKNKLTALTPENLSKALQQKQNLKMQDSRFPYVTPIKDLLHR